MKLDKRTHFVKFHTKFEEWAYETWSKPNLRQSQFFDRRSVKVGKKRFGGSDFQNVHTNFSKSTIGGAKCQQVHGSNLVILDP